MIRQAHTFRARVSGMSFPLKLSCSIRPSQSTDWSSLAMLALEPLRGQWWPRRPARSQGELEAELSEQPCTIISCAESQHTCDGSAGCLRRRAAEQSGWLLDCGPIYSTGCISCGEGGWSLPCPVWSHGGFIKQTSATPAHCVVVVDARRMQVLQDNVESQCAFR